MVGKPRRGSYQIGCVDVVHNYVIVINCPLSNGLFTPQGLYFLYPVLIL